MFKVSVDSLNATLSTLDGVLPPPQAISPKDIIDKKSKNFFIIIFLSNN
jgi:hypothetical protein